MKTREHLLEEKHDLKSYLSQINWDWMILKGQLFLVAIMLIAAISYFLWFI